MPTIEITDHDFSRLQKVAVPFIDTPATVLTRVMDTFERSMAAKEPVAVASPTAPALMVYRHDNLPPLTHTKLIDASFGGLKPDKTTWDSLVRIALLRALKESGTVEGLKRISAANVVAGRKDDDGYKYLTEVDFSYQGVSAEDAVRIVFRCALALKIDFIAEFEWRSKEAAYRPGERARLEYRAR